MRVIQFCWSQYPNFQGKNLLTQLGRCVFSESALITGVGDGLGQFLEKGYWGREPQLFNKSCCEGQVSIMYLVHSKCSIKWLVLLRMKTTDTGWQIFIECFSMSGTISRPLHAYLINKLFAVLLLITSKSFAPIYFQHQLKMHRSWEGTHVHLWLIHVDVWQKSNQCCKQLSFN